MIVRFLDDAVAEVDQATAYYESLSPGLGLAFASQVSHGVERIRVYPNAWQPLGARTRRYRLNRFPYGLVYAVLESEIVVIAVMHLHRAPDYWRDRTAEPG